MHRRESLSEGSRWSQLGNTNIRHSVVCYFDSNCCVDSYLVWTPSTHWKCRSYDWWSGVLFLALIYFEGQPPFSPPPLHLAARHK